ncbi:2-phospho-L-lactate guanylyltransferase [bioreactor metagenome]|uniref:2-phospho-L-lactate guanylyltransferase n=1 Tax=bioreactor metagenome TaxID=1076179 RepID=A0A644ZWR1_9ZZZZ
MSLWAIVPVKPLRRGKSRLASVLSEDERTDLNRNMLVNTIKTLKAVPEIDMILVVSRDPAALALAREFDARTVLEDGSPELNTALRRASKVAQAYQAMEILVIPADLPLVKPEDIQSFLQHSGNPPEVIIAPDRRKDGTNALFINPADLIEFRYGKNSFNVHLDLAKKANARVEVVEMESIALDLDLPEDLDFLKKLEREKQDIH